MTARTVGARRSAGHAADGSSTRTAPGAADAGPAAGGPLGREALAARRAIEALRSGVPSRAAVQALGLGQPDLEDRFTALLAAAADPNTHGGGLLLGGGFGAGKSHALEHFAALAAARGFVVSRVVVSKETPLHDPAKLLRAAVETAVPPTAEGWRYPGTAVAEALAAVDDDSPAFAALRLYTALGELDARFAATVTLAGLLNGPALDASRSVVEAAVVGFWSGAAVRTPDLRRWFKEAGEARPEIRPVAARELARQRLAFLPRLFHAAGWAGWVLLVDEVELIGRYPLLARGRSYAAVADLLGLAQADRGRPFVPVLAVTDDFEAAVLTGKDDRAQVPVRFRARERPEWDELAAAATVGMRALSRDVVLLAPPDDDELDHAYAALRDLHGRAFGWEPPHVPGLERLQATRMRQHVRAWINEWDLVRLDPSYDPVTVAGSLVSRYDEEAALGGDDVGEVDEPAAAD